MNREHKLTTSDPQSDFQKWFFFFYKMLPQRLELPEAAHVVGGTDLGCCTDETRKSQRPSENLCSPPPGGTRGCSPGVTGDFAIGDNLE